MEPPHNSQPPERIAPIAAPDGSSPYIAPTPGALTADGTGGVIPYKNPQALTAYYVGLFSLLPCLGLIMAPAAVWLGIQGLKYAKANPIVKGQAHAWVGIICGGFWSVVYWGSTIFLLLAYLLSH